MTDKLSLGKDAWGQVEEFLHFDSDGAARVTFEGDNTAQMDLNAICRNDGTNGFTESRDMRKIIELDMASYLLIATLNGVKPNSREHDEIVLKLARSNEWRNIKTVDGNIRRGMVGTR